jgi:hypothetical protein
LDGGSFLSDGLVPVDGVFDEETSEAYTFTPVSPVSVGTHTFWTRSTNSFGHTADARSDTLTILNDDGPVLRIGDVTATEGNAGNKNFVFTVSLSPAASANVTVSCVTAGQTATAGSDYVGANLPLTFTPGQTSKTCTVPVIGNTAAEPNETFVVNLNAQTGATIADRQGVARILNDDGPLLRISDVTATEGNAGNKNFVFTVSLSPAASANVTVSCVTAGQTATAGSDYVGVNLPLTFTPGQTSKTCTVPVIGTR